MDVDKEVGRRIANARMLRGLSHRELAEVVDCDESWLKAVESGSVRLGILSSVVLCFHVGVDPQLIFQGLPYKREDIDRVSRHVRILNCIRKAVNAAGGGGQ